MADLLFLLAGIVLFFKKEVSITKHRKLTGRPVKILATLYVLPFATSLVLGFLAGAQTISFATAFLVGTLLVVVAIMATLYFVLFYKQQ